MKLDRKSLVELLPAIYRIRDREVGEPLTRLLSVIAEQIEVLQENVDQLYDDQFIETCAEWVVPYIGDLVGARGVRDVRAAGFSARSFVANTIAYRRRKGTAAMLEQLARDLTGWDAAAVEFFLRLATTQYVNHVRRNADVWTDLRDADAMEQTGTPFERAMRTADVRRIRSRRGKHNIPNVGLFLWRIEAHSQTSSPAVSVDAQRWMFSPLGNDTPLFSLPRTEGTIEHLAARENVPMPITRRVLARQPALWYGDPGSILLRLGGAPVPAGAIQSCDLSDFGAGWDHTPASAGKASIDVVRGRLALPSDPRGVTVSFGAVVDQVAVRDATDPRRYTCGAPGNDPITIKIGGVPVDPALIRVADTVDRWTPPRPDRDAVIVDNVRGRLLFGFDPATPRVTYHYGLPGDVGGGEYEREASFVTPGAVRIVVPSDPFEPSAEIVYADSIAAALTALGTRNGVIEIADSGRYEETLTFTLAANQRVELRGRNGARPTVVLAIDAAINAGRDAELTLNGLLIARGSIAVPAASDLRLLRIRHCTLVPGRTLARDGSPVQPAQVSLSVAAAKSLLSVEIGNSITGPIEMNATAGELTIRNSIVDATRGLVPAIAAAAAANGPPTTIERCTIFGTVRVREIVLASESIFVDDLLVERKQSGCVRFSHVTQASRTPRRYRCQPELAAREAVDARARELAPASLPPAEATAITNRIYATVRPELVSRRYADPAYAQISPLVADAISSGAEDGAEMGVYRAVEAARREGNLRGAIDQYLRFGLEAGIFYAS